jgi:hypothetical protein
VDVLGSIGIAGPTTAIVRADRFRPEHRCIASVRSLTTRECIAVYVNNMLLLYTKDFRRARSARPPDA